MVSATPPWQAENGNLLTREEQVACVRNATSFDGPGVGASASAV
jgi:hypothetical protein